MCNEQRNRIAAGLIRDDFQDLRLPLRFPEGLPNLEPRDSIKITDRNAIIRAGADGGPELVARRWSWPGPTGKPVYNFRSEGRSLAEGRCLIVADGFYEFTDPPPGQKLKSKWLFTKADEPWFCIAGIWKPTQDVGEAYTMLTAQPGPDIAPFHKRQIVILDRSDWGRWLDPSTPAAELLLPSRAGSLIATQVR